MDKVTAQGLESGLLASPDLGLQLSHYEQKQVAGALRDQLATSSAKLADQGVITSLTLSESGSCPADDRHVVQSGNSGKTGELSTNGTSKQGTAEVSPGVSGGKQSTDTCGTTVSGKLELTSQDIEKMLKSMNPDVLLRNDERLRKQIEEQLSHGHRRRNEGLGKPDPVSFDKQIKEVKAPSAQVNEAPNFPSSSDIIHAGPSGDGGTTIERRDGSKQTFWQDGTERMQNPDGTGYVRRPDGTIEHWGPSADDNYKLTSGADGSQRYRYSDGVDMTVNPDGSLTYRNADGTSSTWRRKENHEIITISSDFPTSYWEVQSTDRDGRQHTSRSDTPPPHSSGHGGYVFPRGERHFVIPPIKERYLTN